MSRMKRSATIHLIALTAILDLCSICGIAARPPASTETKKLPLRTTIEAPKAVSELAFSQDSKLLAGRDSSEEIRVWNVDTGKEQTRIKTGGGRIMDFRFSPNGKQLITLAEVKEDNRPNGKTVVVKLWELGPVRELTTVRWPTDHPGFNYAFGISPDLQTFAAGNANKPSEKLTFWDLATGKERLAIPMEKEQGFSGIAVSPDGKLWATGAHSGVVCVWDSASREWVAILSGRSSGTTWPLLFTPDSKGVITTGSELYRANPKSPRESREAVYVWNLGERKERAVLVHPAEYRTKAGEIAAGGRLLAVLRTHHTPAKPKDRNKAGKTVGEIALFDLATGKPAGVLTAPQDPPPSELLCPAKGKYLVSRHTHEYAGAGRPTIEDIRVVVNVWNTTAKRVTATVSGNWVTCRAVACSPDGRLLAIGGEQRKSLADDKASASVRLFELPDDK